jgi:hypothetical protein
MTKNGSQWLPFFVTGKMFQPESFTIFHGYFPHRQLGSRKEPTRSGANGIRKVARTASGLAAAYPATGQSADP